MLPSTRRVHKNAVLLLRKPSSTSLFTASPARGKLVASDTDCPKPSRHSGEVSTDGMTQIVPNQAGTTGEVSTDGMSQKRPHLANSVARGARASHTEELLWTNQCPEPAQNPRKSRAEVFGTAKVLPDKQIPPSPHLLLIFPHLRSASTGCKGRREDATRSPSIPPDDFIG